ncbi:11575_t:CDS:1 [Gigaspora rosea]|nr:11575_t:CDS:1 [Gigaspora rosea]
MEVLEILAIADKLLLMDLLNFIQYHLIKTKSEWLHSYFIKIYQIALSYDSCSKLKDFVLNTIYDNPKLVFKSSDFLTINESLLLSILECDNLDLPENEIWDNVIKWGIFQINSGLSFTKTREEFSALASTLSNCLIRFSQISNNDIYDKVWPFRAILPADLEDDIIRCHLKVGSKPKYGVDSSRFSSVLITHRQMLRIAEWIDRKKVSTYTNVDIPYKFKTLIRGTRDGFDSQTFHQCCDNKGPTIVVMKVACSSEIIGGYNPLKWKIGKWKIGSEHLSTRESFLFSFENGGLLKNAKISRVSRSDYAINIKDESYGPCFGGKDLWMRDNFNQPKSCSAQKDDYETLITKHNEFTVSEYEVFEIIKT